jgi:hypothetical protein
MGTEFWSSVGLPSVVSLVAVNSCPFLSWISQKNITQAASELWQTTFEVQE